MISFNILLLIFAGIFGAVLGSFLNAITFRYNTGAPLWRAMGGRSHCMRCGHELSALDLVPVLSWLALRGRCRYCGAPISVQYPLVELAAAALSIGIAAQYFSDAWRLMPGVWVAYFFWLLVWMTVLFLVVYDWRHLILPLGALILFGILGFVSLFFDCSGVCGLMLPGVWQFVAGPLIALPLFLLWLFSRGRWMGLGDSIFALPVGWVLGAMGGFSALALAFWAGAIIGLVLIATARILSQKPSSKTGLKDGHPASRITLRTEIPFGPFLALGMAAVFFFHINVFAMLVW